MKCYLDLYVFRSGTMHVVKRRFSNQYVRIRYVEASWAGDLVGHDAQRGDPQSYAHMLSKVMAGVHEYLLLSDGNKKSGALKSFKLVGSTARQRDDNMICIWLQDA